MFVNSKVFYSFAKNNLQIYMKHLIHLFYTILILCALSIFSLNAQVASAPKYNFLRGTIITNSHSESKVYISQDFYEDYVKCCYIKSRNDSLKEYLPGEIIGYRFAEDGKFFISKEVPTASGNKVYFLEQLVKGKGNLYFLRNEMDHYYLETDSNKLMELTEPVNYNENKNGFIVKKPLKYYGRLRFLLSKRPELYPDIDKTGLNHKDLIKLVNDYNLRMGKIDESYIYEYKFRPIITRIEVAAGIAYNNFNFLTVKSDYSQGIEMGCNIELYNFFPGSDNQVFKTGLFLQQFSKYNFHSHGYGFVFNGKSYYGVQDSENLDINIVSLRIPATYNYFFTVGNFRPYVGAGFMANLILNQSDKFIIPYYINSRNISNSIPILNFGLTANMGTKFKLKNNHSINLELNYYNTGNIVGNPLMTLTNNTFSLAFGYNL